MISMLSFYQTDSKDPYANLGIEEYLTYHTEPEECILYLWQNQQTVVIGKNQNAWEECKVQTLEAEGGQMVRRMSGGGAVYHDLGNLNFTFCVRKKNYDVKKQLQVIIEAVKEFGLYAEQTGRNDIHIDGRKFSGNAFYESGDYCYHHGTILVDVEKEKMARYLNVSKEKLKAKSVKSVRSRVVNLKELCPDMTIETLVSSLRNAYSKVYGLPVNELQIERFDDKEVKKLQEKYKTWEWNYGRKILFQHQMKERFPWGGVEIQFEVNEGVVQDAICYTDAMNQTYLGAIGASFIGCRYEVNSLIESMNRVVCFDKQERTKIMQDLGHMIRKKL